MTRWLLLVTRDDSLNLHIGKVKGDIEILWAHTGRVCLHLIQKTPVSIALVDDRISDISPLALVEQIREINMDTVMVYLAYVHSTLLEMKVRQLGSLYCSITGDDYVTLDKFLCQALERR